MMFDPLKSVVDFCIQVIKLEWGSAAGRYNVLGTIVILLIVVVFGALDGLKALLILFHPGTEESTPNWLQLGFFFLIFFFICLLIVRHEDGLANRNLPRHRRDND